MKMWKKIPMVFLAGVCALSFSGCDKKGSASPVDAKVKTSLSGQEHSVSDAGKIYKLRLGTIYNDPASGNPFNAFGESVKEFCAQVEKDTNGRVIVTPYYDSLLGGSVDLYEQMRDGDLDIFYGQPMSTIDGRYGIFSIPYLFPDYESIKKNMGSPDAELFKTARDVVNELGGYLLSSNNGVYRGIYNSKREIVAPDDMKGLTIRIYEDKIVQTFWGALCSANIIPYSETFMALQTKIVDGVEHTPSVGATNYYEVCNHYTDINWQWTWGGPLIMSNKTWKMLPSDLQVAIEKAAWESADWYNQKWAEYEQEAMKTMAEKGIQVRYLTNDERQKWIDMSKTMEPEFQKIVGKDFYEKCIRIVNQNT